MSLTWDKLETAKSNKTSIAAVWLDIANAYGSIPHQLIFYSLKRYCINPTWVDLLTSEMFFGVNPSPPKQHLVGTIILGEFPLGIQYPSFYFWQGSMLLLEFIMASIKSSLSSQFTSPVVKAFMDDLFS